MCLRIEIYIFRVTTNTDFQGKKVRANLIATLPSEYALNCFDS